MLSCQDVPRASGEWEQGIHELGSERGEQARSKPITTLSALLYLVWSSHALSSVQEIQPQTSRGLAGNNNSSATTRFSALQTLFQSSLRDGCNYRWSLIPGEAVQLVEDGALPVSRQHSYRAATQLVSI